MCGVTVSVIGELPRDLGLTDRPTVAPTDMRGESGRSKLGADKGRGNKEAELEFGCHRNVKI